MTKPNWEERLKILIGEPEYDYQVTMGSADMELIINFVKNELFNQRKEIVEMIKGMKRLIPFVIYDETRESAYQDEAYNQALDDIISKLEEV